MRLLVVGAGATGSLFAAQLFASGTEVTLLARPPALAAIRAHGLRVLSTPETAYPVPVVDRLPTPDPVDGVVLTVKSFDVEAAGRTIAEGLSTPVPLLATQNGLHIERHLAGGLHGGGWASAEEWVVRAVHSIPATLVAPGAVRPTGSGEMLLPGNEHGEPIPRAAGFHRAFVAAGFSLRCVPDITREVWRKTILNAAINPVTADHGIPNGRLAQDPWRGQTLALLREARRAAQLAGFDFSEAELEKDLWKIVRSTAENHSSMLQDVERGQRTEIDAISGALLEEAQARGVTLPATERIVGRLRSRPVRGPPGGPAGPQAS
jgi:2-dehydropantoate 2-reductase